MRYGGLRITTLYFLVQYDILLYMELHEIATVIAGYTFRKAIKPDIDGNIYVFQAKDLIQAEPFRSVGTLTRISHDIPEYTGHLKQNDVLLVARGMKSGSFRSTVFDINDTNVLASSSVHVVRITTDNVLPEFLSLYLNSKEGQDALSGIVTGSYIGALPRKELEKIKIPIPPLQKQKTLIQLYQNIKEQEQLINRQNEIKQNIINATFKNLTTK